MSEHEHRYSCGKVIFSKMSVSHSVHTGEGVGVGIPGHMSGGEEGVHPGPTTYI